MARKRSRALTVQPKREPLATWAALGTALRAGTIGAGTWLVLVGTVLRSEDHRRWISQDNVFLVGIAVAFAVGLGGAYTTKPKSFLALGARVVGSFFAGCFVGMGLVVASLALHDMARSLPKETCLALLGAVAMSVGLAWGRVARIRAFLEVPSRARTITVGATVLGSLLMLWPHSPLLQCVAGSARGCGRAAESAYNEGDRARAVSFATRGCGLEDGSSCMLAGQIVWEDKHDRRRAEELYREACASGSTRGCDEMARFKLEAGCEGQSATACHELADKTSAEPLKSSYLKAACLLGDDSSCRSR